MQVQADFKSMLKELLAGYGLKDVDFVRKASSPKLTCLGVLELIPSQEELCATVEEMAHPASQKGEGEATHLQPQVLHKTYTQPLEIEVNETNVARAMLQSSTLCARSQFCTLNII